MPIESAPACVMLEPYASIVFEPAKVPPPRFTQVLPRVSTGGLGDEPPFAPNTIAHSPIATVAAWLVLDAAVIPVNAMFDVDTPKPCVSVGIFDEPDDLNN